MKKIVPDPPPVPCVGPGLYHEEAIARAAEHFNEAIMGADSLPDTPTPRNEAGLSTILLNMRIAKALLGVALSASPVTVEV
mgnify:CR=1 FL=1